MVGYGWLVPVNLARLVSGYHDKLNQEPVTTLHLGHWGSREWPS
jgi:hypothetical protein